jgi:hypothetical protein
MSYEHAQIARELYRNGQRDFFAGNPAEDYLNRRSHALPDPR